MHRVVDWVSNLPVSVAVLLALAGGGAVSVIGLLGPQPNPAASHSQHAQRCLGLHPGHRRRDLRRAPRIYSGRGMAEFRAGRQPRTDRSESGGRPLSRHGRTARPHGVGTTRFGLRIHRGGRTGRMAGTHGAHQVVEGFDIHISASSPPVVGGPRRIAARRTARHASMSARLRYAGRSCLKEVLYIAVISMKVHAWSRLSGYDSGCCQSLGSGGIYVSTSHGDDEYARAGSVEGDSSGRGWRVTRGSGRGAPGPVCAASSTPGATIPDGRSCRTDLMALTKVTRL